MVIDPSSPDPRAHPDFDELLVRCLDELNENGFVDSERVLEKHPSLGPALLEDLETFLQLEGADSPEPLGTLGDYTLRRQIGRGGMGTVYDAWQNSMDRRVALKVLPRALAADTRTATRFIREAQIAGKLDHPNVVHVHGTGVEEQVPYYAMEFVDGESLAQILARIKNAEPETVTLFGAKDCPGYFENFARAFADVADGLQHAHSRGVTHRDIKPSNLILDAGRDRGGSDERRLRILDFGLARLEGQESLTLSGDFLGTPLYMSPEQARRRKIPIDHRTDVYSLGATMYEAICNRPPFRGKNHADTLSRIIERDPAEPRKVNSRVPKDLETIVLKCLRKDPGDRYGTAEALGQDLRRFVRGDAIEARPESRLERAIRWTRQHALKLLSASVVVGLALLSAALFLEYREASRLNQDLVLTEAIKKILRHRVGFSTLDDHQGDVFDSVEFAEFNPVENALELLRPLSMTSPQRPEVFFWKARGLLLLDRESEALDALDAALGVDAQFVPARVLKAQLRGEAPQLDIESDDWVSVWIEARTSQREKSWSDAASAYETLVGMLREGLDLPLGIKPDVYIERGVALLATKQYEDAIKSFEAAGALLSRFIEPDLLQAKAYWCRGDEETAERVLDALYERTCRDPQDDDRRHDNVVRSILLVYDSLKEFQRGVPWARRLRDPAGRARFLCSFHYEAKQWDEATAAGETAVKLDPDDPIAWTQLGWALSGQIRRSPPGDGRNDRLPRLDEVSRRAEELAMRSDCSASISSSAHALRGTALHLQERHLEALVACDHSIALDSSKGHGVKGWILVNLSRFSEAESELEESCKRFPWKRNFRATYARVLTKVGKYEKACRELKRCLDGSSPNRAPYVDLARSLIHLRRYREAITYLHQSIETQPHRLGRAQELFFVALWKDPELLETDEVRRLLESFENESQDPDSLAPAKLALFAFLELHVSEHPEPTRALLLAAAAVERTDRRDAEALAVLAEAKYANGDVEDAVLTLREAIRLPDATRRHGELLEHFGREASQDENAENGTDRDILVKSSQDLQEGISLPRPVEIPHAVTRINCGGPECVGPRGNRWESDHSFRGGVVARSAYGDAMVGDDLHASQRIFPEHHFHHGYRYSVPNGLYRLTLHFVECLFLEPGKRRFDIVVEGEAVQEAYEPLEHGFGKVHRLELDGIAVHDGHLDLDLRPVIGDAAIAAIELERTD